MGRKKKYNTKEEIIEANRIKGMIHYWKHRDKIKKECREKYHINKNKLNLEELTWMI